VADVRQEKQENKEEQESREDKEDKEDKENLVKHMVDLYHQLWAILYQQPLNL
jgi:hypothetical protein